MTSKHKRTLIHCLIQCKMYCNRHSPHQTGHPEWNQCRNRFRNQRGWILLESLVALSLLAGLGSHLFHQQQRIHRLLMETQHQLQAHLDRENRFESNYLVP